MLERTDVGFSCTYLRLRLSCLAARARRVQFCKQLPFFNVGPFFHQKPLDCRTDGSVRLEVLDRLNFAIGGNYAADGAAGDRSSQHRIVA